jgi:hypothetical protein
MTDIFTSLSTFVLNITDATSRYAVPLGCLINLSNKHAHLLAVANGEWTMKGTTDKERAKQLLAADFTYQLTTPDGTMLFKKPK